MKSSTGPNSVSYSYDADGNLLTRNLGTTGWTYSWNPVNQLVKASSNGVVQGVYAYDGRGRRVESVEGSTTFYAYLGTETLSEIVSGGATTDYIYAAGLRIVRTTGTTTSYYHTDALGSTRLVTDSKQNLLFSDNYQPFGQDNMASGSETYKFTGKPVSQTIGLYYDYQRWYDL